MLDATVVSVTEAVWMFIGCVSFGFAVVMHRNFRKAVTQFEALNELAKKQTMIINSQQRMIDFYRQHPTQPLVGRVGYETKRNGSDS